MALTNMTLSNTNLHKVIRDWKNLDNTLTSAGGG